MRVLGAGEMVDCITTLVPELCVRGMQICRSVHLPRYLRLRDIQGPTKLVEVVANAPSTPATMIVVA
jgi:hypothetical protein